MGSNDIKDKKILVENRKLIESEMERFKACEKEMKTKAYSKEGLTNSTRLDPREKEKLDTANFISEMLEDLEHQVESLEAEQEMTRNSMKRNKKDTQKQDRISELEDQLDRHKWHISKLELIMRMLENGNLSADAINNIQDDIRYYVESNQEPDFAEDEEIYDELNLDDDDDALDGQGVDDDDEQLPGNSLEDLAVEHEREKDTVSKPVSPVAQKESLARKIVVPTTPVATVATAVSPTLTGMKPAPPPARSTNELKYASAAAAAASAIPQGLSPLPPVPGEETEGKAVKEETVEEETVEAPPVVEVPVAKEEVKEDIKEVPVPKEPPQTTEPSNITLPPGLQDLVNSYDAAKHRLAAPPPIDSITTLLQRSYAAAPDTAAERQPQFYQPISPYPTPSCYPGTPLASVMHPAVFAKMDVDTLFYVFYYQQGTYAQYLAAKELKSRSWRFHKHFVTWFQRHEEPKSINNDYEQGTYRYFDFEGIWAQRRKQNFTFEYKYLEDELV